MAVEHRIHVDFGQAAAVVDDVFKLVGNLGVRFDRDACGLQRGFGFGVQTASVGKQDGTVFADKQEGHENRVERHVAATQVGQPSDVVK